MGNAVRYLVISFVIAFIIGIFTVYLTGNPDFAGMIVLGIFILVVIYLISTRCSRCGNLAAVYVSNTQLLNTNQSQNHFTREEAVGASVRRNRYGDVIDDTTHYGDVNYVTTTTTKTYEDTKVCKYCGAVSKNRYQKQSNETHRL